MDPLTTNNFILGLTAWAIAFLVVLWISLIIWTYRDIRSRLPRSPDAHPGCAGSCSALPAWHCDLPDHPPPAHPGRRIPAHAGGRGSAPIHRRKPTLPGLRTPHPRDLVGLPELLHQAQKALSPVRQADGAALEPVPLLRHTRPRHAQGKHHHG